MSKKLLSLICLACAAALLCSCGFAGRLFGNGQKESGGAYGELKETVQSYLLTAQRQSDAGMSFSGGYYYGMAQAEVSSLRLCVDTVLWLLGEGENLQEVIGDAPFDSWDSIAAAGMGSDAPYYFEGLIHTFGGRDASAGECRRKAEANPSHRDRDFYYLRNLSVEELYSMKEELRELEDRIFSEYAPETVLCAARTGAEYAPQYHLALAQLAEDPAAAARCALNALYTGPGESALYSAAAAYAIDASDAELGCRIVNEGLFLFPADAELNWLAAALSLAAGDSGAASSYLDAAEKTAGDDLMSEISAMRAKIGGQS